MLVLAAGVLCAELSGLPASSRAAEKPATPPAAETAAVLGLEQGSFVGYARWKTPSVVTRSGRTVPLLEPGRKDLKSEDRRPMPVVAAEPPGKDWTAAGFDESRWVRVRGPLVVPQGAWGYGLAGAGGASIYMPGNQVEWGLVCLRGTFRVDDPATVKDLRLSLRYLGGVVVHVNGRELCRGHLPQGPLDFDTLADRYPDEAYVRPDGHLYTKADERKSAEGTKIRVRELGAAAGAVRDARGVAIPASLLRKGVNVLAVEAHAAPISELLYAYDQPRGEETPWPHVGVLEAGLTAAAGVEPNVGPTDAVGLWTSQPLETVEAWDYAHPAERVWPIRLVAARNGTFSGKVVLSSKNTIRIANASVSDLIRLGAAARIPAAAIEVRRAERASPDVSWRNPPYYSNRFDRLLANMPSEVAPVKATLGYGVKFQPAPAAVVPIWVTVHVPADAAPGEYRGTLSIDTAGADNVTFIVPIELKVHDWTLPDPKDFSVHHNLYQSPDTVARYYKVPLWSERHFQLMGKSLEVLHQVGNKLCVIYLVAMSSALNNSESMVRWIRRPDGSYDHDFTLLEKYLDLYAAKAGKPGILQINIWENNYSGGERQGFKPPQPLGVNVLDPASGRIERMPQPPYGTPENEAFWKPVMTELGRRLERRGWFDVAAVVNASYCWDPSKEVVTVYKHLWPDGKWMNATHGNPRSYAAKEGSMPVPYSEWVWGSGFPLYDPDRRSREQHPFYPRAWKLGGQRIELSNPRAGTCIVNAIRDNSELAIYRTISEAALQGNLRGFGRVGGDFWPLPAAKQGTFQALCTDYGGCSMPDNTLSVTTPGPDGAIFNERMEMLREGVEVAEAIIFVQRALEAGKIEGDLARRAAAVLDERARYYLRARFPHVTSLLSYETSNWQERDDRLFALAAEVAKTAGK
ncbi:MAG: glycoside hydrolase domain-containing protein [Thermoguttaceae bacterium]|jgi:hypothetical protein